MYGALNWYDESAAACAEMVFDLIRALGVPLSVEIATHIYLGILTDTGSFHHSNITPRTFDICRQTVEAGVNPAIMARRVFNLGIGRMLDDWHWLSLMFNRVNRAMGQRDLYPFELPDPVIEKLAFVHDLVTRGSPRPAAG